MLTDHINVGICFFAEKNLMLEKAITTAQSLQAADKEAHEMA